MAEDHTRYTPPALTACQRRLVERAIARALCERQVLAAEQIIVLDAERADGSWSGSVLCTGPRRVAWRFVARPTGDHRVFDVELL